MDFYYTQPYKGEPLLNIKRKQTHTFLKTDPVQIFRVHTRYNVLALNIKFCLTLYIQGGFL